jgi:hypothetical protein
MKVSAGLLVCTAFVLSMAAWPQAPQDAGQQDSGQPARAVRLSYVDGKVSLTQGDQVIAAQAVANTPLFEGTTVAAANDGRAEIQFEDGSVARIAPGSSLTLKVLTGVGTSGNAEMVLDRGLGYFELQNGAPIGAIRVHFGDNVVSARGVTVLRIRMDTPPGDLAVFSGNAHLEAGNDTLDLDLHGGESVKLDAANPNRSDLVESIEPDSWDAWNSDRDQERTAEAAARTGASGNVSDGQGTNPEWNDLDANGSWYNVPDQGYVWSPYDAANADFDPYGVGNWMYTPGYGYVWASGYSWGYLPFQCGMWNFYDGFGWGWAPGSGGCHPWWGMGFYGGANIGFAPPGYRHIERPHPGWSIGRHPHPVIAVNRHATGFGARLPARGGNAPVTIAGHSVSAFRPQSAGYAHNGAGYTYHTAPAYGVAAGQSGAAGQSSGARQSYISNHSSYTPAERGMSGQGAAPNPTYTAPVQQNHPQPGRTYFPSGQTSPAYGRSNSGGSHPPAGGGGWHGGGSGGFHGGGGGGHR